MHPVKRKLNDLVLHISKCAEIEQAHRQLDERMFLFGIEIGRRKALTSYERVAYRKTFRTAQMLLMTDEAVLKTPDDAKVFKNVFMEAVCDWLRNSRVIQTWLEREMRCCLSEESETSNLSPETRMLLLRYLELVALRWPEVLSRREIKSFMDRLEHPLDRA